MRPHHLLDLRAVCRRLDLEPDDWQLQVFEGDYQLCQLVGGAP